MERKQSFCTACCAACGRAQAQLGMTAAARAGCRSFRHHRMVRQQCQAGESEWGTHESDRPVYAGSPLPATTVACSRQAAATSRVSEQRRVDAMSAPPDTCACA